MPSPTQIRSRLADVEYEIAKETNKKITLEEGLKSRFEMKETCAKHNVKWELTYQLGIEQTELEIKIREAVIDKLINEVKFLRLELAEAYEKSSA